MLSHIPIVIIFNLFFVHYSKSLQCIYWGHVAFFLYVNFYLKPLIKHVSDIAHKIFYLTIWGIYFSIPTYLYQCIYIKIWLYLNITHCSWYVIVNWSHKLFKLIFIHLPIYLCYVSKLFELQMLCILLLFRLNQGSLIGFHWNRNGGGWNTSFTGKGSCIVVIVLHNSFLFILHPIRVVGLFFIFPFWYLVFPMTRNYYFRNRQDDSYI